MTPNPTLMRCSECGALGTAVEMGICCWVESMATGPQWLWQPHLSTRPKLRSEASTLEQVRG
jgi:hypothetical protein